MENNNEQTKEPAEETADEIMRRIVSSYIEEANNAISQTEFNCYKLIGVSISKGYTIRAPSGDIYNTHETEYISEGRKDFDREIKRIGELEIFLTLSVGLPQRMPEHFNPEDN